MKKKETVLSYKELHQLTGDGIDHSGEFRVLIVDDNVFDSELMLRKLQHQSKIKFISKIVTDKDSYEEALKTFLPDVVYCDFSISPDFNALTAIRALKKDHPGVSFVLVTGTLTEEAASLCISEGIDDYVLKSNMERLPLSLINSINKRKIELQKKEAYEKLVKAESQVRNFAMHLNRVLEDERTRIAREIHDEFGQQFAGIKMGLSSFKKLGFADKSIEDRANSMIKDVDSIIQSLKKIAMELRPGILDTLGLVPSIEWLAKEFQAKRRIKCKMELDVKEHKFEEKISTCFFRICQEALTNVSKHAKASEVIISVNQDKNELTLKVSDNGKGIDSEKPANPFSMGLIGMQERARIINARLHITSQKDLGTTIHLSHNLQDSPLCEKTSMN